MGDTFERLVDNYELQIKSQHELAMQQFELEKQKQAQAEAVAWEKERQAALTEAERAKQARWDRDWSLATQFSNSADNVQKELGNKMLMELWNNRAQ